MIKKTVLSVAVLLAIATSAQAGLTGETVRASYVVPAGTIFTPGEFSVKNFLVTDGVESTKFGRTGNVKVDIGDDYLELTSLFMGRSIYDAGQYKFKLLNQSVSFDSVIAVDLGTNIFTTSGSSTRFEQSRVSFTSTELTLNMAGLSLPGNAPIRLSIHVSEAPEASTYAMLLVALPIVACAVRRKRVAS